MKYLLIVIAFCTMLLSSNLNWNSDYYKALEEAKVKNKDVYMLITSDSCKWCRKFESTTLQDKSVIKRLKGEYILLHIDRDKNYFPKKFKSTPVPRHYFLTNKGQKIYSFLGFWEKNDFFSFLKDVDNNR